MEFEDLYSLVDEIHAKCDFSVNRNTRFGINEVGRPKLLSLDCDTLVKPEPCKSEAFTSI